MSAADATAADVTGDPIGAFVEGIASELAAEGFPRMPAYVLMTLTALDSGRATSAELAERLGVSAAAISGAVKYLTVLGFVRSSTVSGSRQHVYTLPEVPWYTYSLSRPEMYLRTESLLRSSLARMPQGPARERIEEMTEFFAFLSERLPQLLVEWRARRGESAQPE
jgi:DNA-binding transcriptional regulator GbsR (MarR family)